MLVAIRENVAALKKQGRSRDETVAANIAAASPQLAPRLNRSSLWLTLARPEEKRQKS
jgi:hypothetical protein